MLTKKRFQFPLLLSIAVASLLIFPNCKTTAQVAKNKLLPTFIEAKRDFPRVEKNLRKWDAPVIADLDQDGYVDLLLNDHGLGVSVCWNNKGSFAKPYDIIMGDLHGITVGDFDFDGNLEIVISRGGGSGGNARNSKIFRVTKEREFTAVPDFEVPLELMRGRTVKFIDGDNDGDLDLINFAFASKERNGESENYIYENNGKGQLILNSTLPYVKKDGQKTLVTDFNGDNILDLLLYGHGSVKAYEGKGDLTYKDVSDKLFPYEIKNVSGIVEFDYDNDGDFDLFLTRGKEFEIGETFFDAETKVWGFFTKRGAFQFEDLEIGDVLNLENYQAQWPYNDAVYIGETGYAYEFPGETHSGKDIRLVNSDALGFPDNLNEEGGAHFGYVGNQKWRLAGDTGSPTTGIVHGVLAYPEANHPKGLNDILLENKKGKFIDNTKEANLYLEEHTTGVTVADLDNNGFTDLIILRRGDLIHENKSLVYMNQGERNFVLLEEHNIVSTELGAIGMAIENIDYNQDGKVDIIIGNERGKWHLFKNTIADSEKANHIVVEVGHSESGKATALGALVSIQSCSVQQVKRVGTTGGNYSLSFDNFVHFGLGDCGGAVDVKVNWSNGEVMERRVMGLGERVFFGKE